MNKNESKQENIAGNDNLDVVIPSGTEVKPDVETATQSEQADESSYLSLPQVIFECVNNILVCCCFNQKYNRSRGIGHSICYQECIDSIAWCNIDGRGHDDHLVFWHCCYEHLVFFYADRRHQLQKDTCNCSNHYSRNRNQSICRKRLIATIQQLFTMFSEILEIAFSSRFISLPSGEF